jgi:hypothetical protein
MGFVYCSRFGIRIVVLTLFRYYLTERDEDTLTLRRYVNQNIEIEDHNIQLTQKGGIGTHIGPRLRTSTLRSGLKHHVLRS